MLHGFVPLPFWLALAGIAPPGTSTSRRPTCRRIAGRSGRSTRARAKYGFDELYEWFFAGGARRLGTGLLARRRPDAIIDGADGQRLGARRGLVRGVIRHCSPAASTTTPSP
jgi:NADH-quinone oxidoreductase subunit L